jgi:hypothetical protein
MRCSSFAPAYSAQRLSGKKIKGASSVRKGLVCVMAETDGMASAGEDREALFYM